jgi:hypothetical protein
MSANLVKIVLLLDAFPLLMLFLGIQMYMYLEQSFCPLNIFLTETLNYENIPLPSTNVTYMMYI